MNSSNQKLISANDSKYFVFIYYIIILRFLKINI